MGELVRTNLNGAADREVTERIQETAFASNRKREELGESDHPRMREINWAESK